MTASPQPILRITGPAQLVPSVPYLLGFTPVESLVVVGLADGRLIGTARMDIADLSAIDVAVFAALANAGVEAAILLLYTETDVVDRDGVDDLVRRAAEPYGIDLIEVLQVRGERYHSLLCEDETCCPPDGWAFDATSPAVVEAVANGMASHGTRADLEASVAPIEGATESVRPAIEAFAAAQPDPSELRRVLIEAAKQGSTGDIAYCGYGLSLIPVRDALWLGIDNDALQIKGEFWAWLARRLPAPWSAPAYFLAAWTAYRAGDGAMANIALAQAIKANPDYSASSLLAITLERGINPNAMPRLELPEGVEL